jgi:hypothetical protein
MLTKIGALLCTSLLGIELAIVPASAQSSSKPFVVFVNGSGDCCAGAMWNVKQTLEGQGATIWTTSYASFKDGSTTNKAPVVNLSTDMDNAFIFGAVQVLNSVPKSTPIILIGHSYGGDSILKVLPFIQRRIQLVVTIDPVGTGGSRQIATSRRVPSNVDYFMNRWQENGLALDNIVPFDSRTDGSIPCSAGVCDQKSQNLARNADGSEIRVSCGAEEVSCDGWTLPGCNFGGCWKGSNGTKAKRMFHNDMPIDDSIQRTVGDKIQERLAAFSPPIGALVNGGGKCLDVDAPQMRNNGGKVQVWDCNGQPQQQWSFRGNALVNGGGKCLDVDAPQMRNNGGKVQVWDCNGQSQQQWRF